jgi:hypothetical protein
MSEMTSEIVYVSWGGSGTGAALRGAHARAVENDRGLVYLAILDPPTFSDIDDDLRELVTEELTWLLQAQLALVQSEYRGDRVPTRFVVRTGAVLDEVVDLVQTIGSDLILVGAPVAIIESGSVDVLIKALADHTEANVELVGSASA